MTTGRHWRWTEVARQPGATGTRTEPPSRPVATADRGTGTRSMTSNQAKAKLREGGIALGTMVSEMRDEEVA